MKQDRRRENAVIAPWFVRREFLPAAGQMKMQIVPLAHDSFVIRL
jgi:hypothetical protein